MRITQANVNLKFFRAKFLQQFGFVQYCDRNAPALFYGCFESLYEKIKRHRALGVIVWCGSDSLQLQKRPDFCKYLQSRKNLFHIAETKFISDDLTNCGIPHEIYPFNIINIGNPYAKPLGKNVYVYSSHTNPEFYGASIVSRIKQRLPDINFIVRYANPPDCASAEELKQIYEDSCIGLRLVHHDGMSCTVAELGLMGRKVVWNSDAPNAIPWKNDDDIVCAILQEYDRAGETDLELAVRMVEFLKIPEIVFETDHYIKKSENKIIKNLNIKRMKKVSVVINSYNDDPNHLRAAINSYLNQIGVEVELIISTVQGDKAISFAKAKGLKLVISEEPGIYRQLNAGIEKVSGDYFCFASGNDVAMRKKLKFEMDLLEKSGKSVCYSAFNVVDAKLMNHKTRSFHAYSYAKHLEGNFVSDCSLMKTEILNKYKPFNEIFDNMAFYDFWLRVAEGEGEEAFLYNPVPTWLYRVTKDSKHVIRKKDPEAIKANEELRVIMLGTHLRAAEDNIEEPIKEPVKEPLMVKEPDLTVKSIGTGKEFKLRRKNKKDKAE